MAVTHTLTLNWNYGNQQIANNVSVSSDSMVRGTTTVAGSTTDQAYNINIDVSELKVLYLYSDQTVTLETNSSSSPANTLTLTAGNPLVWYYACGITNPLTTDVTKFYFTNAGASTATIDIAVLQDATP